MLRNNTRIIAFTPRFSNLVTRECLEKLAGTRKASSNANQDQAKGTLNNITNTSIYPSVPDDDFSRRTGSRTRNSSGLAGGARGGRRPDLPRHGLPQRSMPSSESMAGSSSSSSSQLGGHAQFQQQPEHRRTYRHKRSKSLREPRSRQLLSVLHEEETFPAHDSPLSPPTSSSTSSGCSWHPSSTDVSWANSDVTSSLPPDPPADSSTPDDSIHNSLVRTRNAKGSSSRRFGNEGGNSSSSCTSTVSSIPNKRQCFWKRRSRRFRVRLVATLVVIRTQYQSLVSSLKGVERRREYANFDAMSVNPIYDSPFVDDLDSPIRRENKLLQFDHDHPSDLTEFRTVKVGYGIRKKNDNGGDQQTHSDFMKGALFLFI
ncbi:hypothetical protein R1sor_010390 [Riccia sorocarpa]|uniref:Uncharacterized protein n=1 Tax=Riccia sorocarpa TaxID=122646 RepID=A0ABD3I1B9_9MARC